MGHLLRLVALSLLVSAPFTAAANSLDREMVKGVIKQRQAAYQKCYEDALTWSPDLKGRLLIRFTVESDGTVSAAAEQTSATEKFPDEVMARCVTDQFLLLTFPAGPQAYHVTYPLIFTPPKSGKTK